MATFPPRSPLAQPTGDIVKRTIVFDLRIRQLEERIKNLENKLEENRKLLEEIRDLIKNLEFISQEIFKSHRHEYDKRRFLPRWLLKKEKTSPPI